jgi:hypothetical protein
MHGNNSDRARQSNGASLGAMLILLDLRPEMIVNRQGSEMLADAIERCLTCPTHATCARWLADPERRPEAWRGFCPNVALFDHTQIHRPRRR